MNSNERTARKCSFSNKFTWKMRWTAIERDILLKSLLKLIAIVVFGIFVFVILTINEGQEDNHSFGRDLPAWWDIEYGECYMRGVLDRASLPFADVLHSLQLDRRQIASLENPSRLTLADVQIVSAWSSNHHHEGLHLCRSVNGFEELKKVKNLKPIVYDLGDLSKSKYSEYRTECGSFQFRRFNSTKYPKIVGRLKEYRWKVILIAEAMIEFSAVLWLDSSMRFITTNRSLQEIVEKASEKGHGVWVFGDTGHSIAAATNPRVAKYFPISHPLAVATPMFEANHILWIRSYESVEHILRPLVQCALIEDCLAPPQSYLHCKFKNEDRRNYANCHRFDQSALNMILAIHSHFHLDEYRLADAPMKAFRL